MSFEEYFSPSEAAMLRYQLSHSTLPVLILYEGEDELVHTAENNYHCEDKTCPCQPEETR